METDQIKSIVARAFRGVDLFEKVKSFAMLTLLAFSIFLGIAAPFELYQVYTVNQWPKMPAKVLNVELKRTSPSWGSKTYWDFELELTNSGEKVSTTDVRPGDLPLSTLNWSTTDWDAARYQIGQETEVYRSPEGGKVFLERGSYGFMVVMLCLCVSYWGWILRRAITLRGGK